MTGALVICEKPTQAADIRAAVGDSFGQVLPAQGHLVRLAEPEEVDPRFATWGYEVLVPPGGLYPLALPDKKKDKTAEGRIAKLDAIGKALKGASQVVIATDCDREGQLIGEEILRFHGYRGHVLRAMFTAQDKVSLRKAFDNLRPNEEYRLLGEAAVARQQADQIFNLTLTRAATTAFVPPGARGVVGVGRVKTPTMAIVVMRELEIRDFKPEDYFEVVAKCRVEAGSFQMRHAPDPRIKDRARATAVAQAAVGVTGPLAVKVERKRRQPPKLYDLPSLQKVCSSKFGWDASHTLQVAQSLYEGSGAALLTYPRAEARYLPEVQASDAPKVLSALARLGRYGDNPAFKSIRQLTVRKGKAGHFYDKGLEGLSHHAVVPNVNVLDEIDRRYAMLDQDQRRLFHLVADNYVTAMMPDYVYDATTVSLDASGALFLARGAQPVEWGWRGLARGISGETVEDEEDDGGTLPALRNEEPGTLAEATVEAKRTQPPPRYTDGSLIDAMQNAWRFVPDPAWQERLKEAKGIGTPATRDQVIAGLKRQGFFLVKDKKIFASDAAITLYTLFRQVAAIIVSPGTTAAWEMRLDSVLRGQVSYRQVIDEIVDTTTKAVAAIQKAGEERGAVAGMGRMNPPSEKMLKAARAVAQRKGLVLPRDIAKDFAQCKAFLDAHMDEQEGPYPPSPKQIEMARGLAAQIGRDIPDSAMQDGKALSAWIDEACKAAGRNSKKARSSACRKGRSASK